MHISFGMPFTSAEHDPHLPALQFQRQARSFAWVRLNVVYRIEHDHAFGNFGGVIVKCAASRIAAPDFERSVHLSPQCPHRVIPSRTDDEGPPTS